MQSKIVTLAILFIGTLTAALGESTVTLKSGEVLQGDVLSDTNGVLEIRAYSHNRTISSIQDVPHSDIQTIQTDTPAQAAERADYFALSKFQLNADQEQTPDFYAQWIAAFEKFLTDYPQSDKVPIISNNIQKCRTELPHVANGEAKFENQWMPPVEKSPLLLKKQLTVLQSQRDSLIVSMGQKQAELAGLQAKLSTLQDTQEPVYATRLVGPHHHSETYFTGQMQTVPNPERPEVAAKIASCQKSIDSWEQALTSINTKIADVQSQIPRAEQDYQTFVQSQQPSPATEQSPPTNPSTRNKLPPEKSPLFLKEQLVLLEKQLADLQSQEAFLAASLNQPQGKLSQQQINLNGHAYDVVLKKEDDVKFQISKTQHDYEVALYNQKLAEAPTSPPPLSTVAPESWIAQHWRGLAIGGGILLISLVGVYPLKRVLQKSELAEAARNEQRRVAREKLKKVFDRIFKEGERPKGMNMPDGEVIPIGQGENAYGGGRWFVVGDSHIWAVQNNGRDDDNWVYNNVTTKGHGAVGARIVMDSELADYIRTEANAQRS